MKTTNNRGTLRAGGKNYMVDCRCCGKRTHSNIDGNNTDMCRSCMTESYLENCHADGYHDSDNEYKYDDDDEYGADNCPECHPDTIKPLCPTEAI